MLIRQRSIFFLRLHIVSSRKCMIGKYFGFACLEVLNVKVKLLWIFQIRGNIFLRLKFFHALAHYGRFLDILLIFIFLFCRSWGKHNIEVVNFRQKILLQLLQLFLLLHFLRHVLTYRSVYDIKIGHIYIRMISIWIFVCVSFEIRFLWYLLRRVLGYFDTSMILWLVHIFRIDVKWDIDVERWLLNLLSPFGSFHYKLYSTTNSL